MTLDPGYVTRHGCLVFLHPIEWMMVQVAEGFVSMLILTCHGVTRLEAGKIRPRRI